MFTCPNCNKTYDIPMNFCIVCGTPMAANNATPPPTAEPTVQTQYAEQQYAPPQPVQVQPQYVRPQYVESAPSQDTPPRSAKIKCCVGMGLSIYGLIPALIGLIYGAMFAILSNFTGETTVSMFSVFYTFAALVNALPFSLTGLILSINGMNNGCHLAFGKVGKILGIVGTIICGILLVLVIINFAVVSGSFYDVSYYY